MTHKSSTFFSFIIALSIVFAPFAPITSAATLPTIIFNPATLAPDSDIVASATGFTPQSTVTISLKGQTFGVDLIFHEIKKKTGTDGSVVFTGHVPPTDTGTASFDFTDERGLTATGTYTVTGTAPRKFLLGGEVAVTDTDIQVGITGVGWDMTKKKTVKGFDPNDEPYDPSTYDFCMQGQCPERADALKLALVLPKTTTPGIHTFRVGQSGDAEELQTKVTIPETAENKNKKERRAQIFLVDPPAASIDIPSIAVRGSDWGPYDDRGETRAWFVDQETNKMYPLKVDRNYRDCTFSVRGGNLTGGCSEGMKPEELFLRLEIPEELKPVLEPKTYLIYIRTENNIYGGAPFTLLTKPLFQPEKGASIAISPTEGPTGTFATLFGTGYGTSQGLNLRFDGVRLSLHAAFITNRDGTFENVGFFIPTTLTRNNKTIPVAPGRHTIDVSSDSGENSLSAQTTFIIPGEEKRIDTDQKKKEEEQKKKEQEERERLQKEQEQLKKQKEQAEKEQARIEKEKKDLEKKLKEKQEQEKKQKDEAEKQRLEKERQELEKKLKEKQEQEQKKEQKIEDIKKKQDDIQDRFCDAALPITFQPGCIPPKAAPQKSPYEGKLCRADLAITFQPGCIAQKIEEQKKLFEGKQCSSDIPLVWQEGCIPQQRITPKSEFEGKACSPDLPIVFQPGCVPQKKNVTASPYQGKPCTLELPITFQPGCVSQPRSEPEKIYKGKTCDSNLPLVWQEGCIQQPKAQYVSPFQGKPCSADMPITFQPGCVSQPPAAPQKPYAGKICDPNLPLVWQEGCIQQQTIQSQQSVPISPSLSTSPQSTAPKKCDPNIPHYSQPNCIE